MEHVIEMKHVMKSFSGVNVLNNVSFAVKKGEVRALVGGNGAGKSTLMKILTGVYSIDQGEINVFGEPVHFRNFSEARTAGISMIFQELSLIPSMSVSENIFLTCEPLRNRFHIDKKQQKKQTLDLMKSLSVEVNPSDLVSDITVGNSQLVEIAKALAMEAKVLIMDEPTASLSDRETDILFDLIGKLKAEGVTIIYISHRMGEIFKVADSITVLKDGSTVSTRDAADTDIKQVIADMIGREAGEEYRYKPRTVGKELLFSVKGMKVDTPVYVDSTDIDVYKGEILGLAGLMGSGRTEILETIFGLNSGKNSISINGNNYTIGSVTDAVQAGIALVPDDRRKKGLVLDHSIKENLLLPALKKISRNGSIRNDIVSDFARTAVSDYDVKTPGINKQISLLSGGNQQKVVLAKWLSLNPDLLLLDEPTAGVDIGAKVEIVEMIRQYADSGKAVIVVSSEIHELMAMCDRIMVMHKGRITKEIQNSKDLEEERLQYEIQHEN
ncbi:MAG: sugar ABC transporter ATP-binding protein [Spirochaetaceae bacterium]|nr:sugar ABC transporter ATP-binding protein [Spirochaetaceae bacterium]